MNDAALAKKRGMFLILIRLGGTFFAMLGALILAGKITEGIGTDPKILGIAFLVIGTVDALFMPVFLARKWKSQQK